MQFRPGDLVFVDLSRIPFGQQKQKKFWALVLTRPLEDSMGNLYYRTFCSDGKKREISALYLRHPREVTPIYQGEREGNPEGGKPDKDVP